MTLWVLLISVVAVLISASDWRKGLLAILLIGVLQDVLRKLTPGVPSYYILWSMAVYSSVFVFAYLSRSLPDYRILFLGDTRIRNTWVLFFILIALQLVNALVRFGGVGVPILGALFYIGPPLAMLVGAAFLDREWRIKQFLLAYLLIFVPVCMTVFLSARLEDSWPVLEEIGSFVGRSLIIYDVGTVLESYSGLLRAGENAAWHAATASMFLAIMALNSSSNTKRFLYSLLIVVLIAVIVMTGRRKMLMTLSIFFVVQWVLLARFRHGMGKLSVVLIIVGTLGSYSFTLLEPASQSNLYAQRSTSVFGDATTRFSTAVSLMKSGFHRSSGMGLGAGAGAQGAAYTGANVTSSVGGSAESGIGKLMVEIGVPGILTAMVLLVMVGRRILKNMKWVAGMGQHFLVYQVSFAALMFANLATFTVATQVYGDLFILILLGTVGGFIVQINEKARQFAIFQARRNVENHSAVPAQTAIPGVTVAAQKRL